MLQVIGVLIIKHLRISTTTPTSLVLSRHPSEHLPVHLDVCLSTDTYTHASLQISPLANPQLPYYNSPQVTIEVGTVKIGFS